MRVEVVRIVSTHPPSQGAFVEINASDFDSTIHELFDPPAAQPAAPAAEHVEPAHAPAKRGPGRPRKN